MSLAWNKLSDKIPWRKKNLWFPLVMKIVMSWSKERYNGIAKRREENMACLFF